jgi:hypothetical protein
MSYRCGIGPRLANLVNLDGDPRPCIICDGCGAKIAVEFPPKWFLAGKSPPGWRTIRRDDGSREDYCRTCKGDLS